MSYRASPFPVLFFIVLLCCSCGGGASGQQQSPPPPPPSSTPDFSLAVNPKSVTVFTNNGSPVSVSASAIDGFNSQISVQISALPAGVSATPATFTLVPGSSQNVVFSAAANASVGTMTTAFTGTSGSLSHVAYASVSVSNATVAVLPTRTRYVRSDAVTEYGYSLNTHWAIYHGPTSRFFVTDPYSNQVFVFDPVTETEVASITVPGAYGIDETPDQSTLYVGTLIGDVYTIDPVAMTVTHRYLASQIGPSGFQASIALPLSNGSIALLGSAGGIPSVDGSPSFAVWNPGSNSITIYGAGGVPMTQVCGPLANIGGFTLTADRSAVILGSIDSDATLCEVNATTGQGTYIGSGASFVYRIVVSADGNYIALPATASSTPDQVVLYNAHTLAEMSEFTVAGDVNSASNLMFSPDSQTLFVPNQTTVYAYSVPTGQLVGWLPNIQVQPETGGFNVGPAASPNYEAMDTTGLLAGPLEEGFGFLDTTTLQTGPVDATYTNAYLTPATGPISGGTQVQWSLPNDGGSFSPSIYFDGNQGTSASVSSYTATVTTPAGYPGPVPVYLFAPDGGMQLVPDGFSYGPTILEVTPNISTAEGGGPGVIYGYGFGPALSATVPANLSVTVGGVSATIVGFNGQAYNTEAPPFPLQAIYYTIPPGLSGTSTDVVVTSSSGSTVAQNSMSYLPTPQQYALSGSQLAQGIYDPVRDVYYFTDANRIQVFSLTQGQWLSPINIPAPNGASQRLWGIALSPDGSKLAVADSQANVIYLIDPTNTSSVLTFPFAPSESPGVIAHPVGVAMSDAGMVYIAAFVEGGTGYHAFFKLDTNTGALTDYGIDGPGEFIDGVPQDVYLRTEISSDNSTAFFNADGGVFTIDTATDTVSRMVNQGCCGNYDLALSNNQTQFEASSYLYDTSLNAESSLVMNDREALDISYVYGTKFSPDGTLLFQPSTNGIDVFDGRLGTLLNRIALPFALSTNYDALVEDGQDNKLIAITGTNGDGIAVVDLSSIVEPGPLSYAAKPSSKPVLNSMSGRNLPSNPSHADGTRPGSRIVPHVTHFILAPSHGTVPPSKF